MSTSRFLKCATNALICIATLQVTIGSAETIQLNTGMNEIDGENWNQGWWSDTRPNPNAANVSYFIGTNLGAHRNFFTFAIPPIDGVVKSATLTLIWGSGSDTNELTEQIGFFDVITDPVTLNNNVGTSVAIFKDLGEGTSYGVTTVSGSGGTKAPIDFPLNSAAVAAIHAHQETYFSIGGKLISDNGDDWFIGGVGAGILSLEVVPEPTSSALIAGVIGVSFLFTRLRVR